MVPLADTRAQAVLAEFFERCHRRQYPAHATVISAGEYSSSLYYLVSGSVSVLIEDDEGHEMVLAYLYEGDFFGEIGLFDEHHERSAWVRTRTPCSIAYLPYEQLRALTVEAPELIFAMLAQTSLRLRDTSRKLGDLAFKDVAGRIARALLDLCEHPEAVERPEGVEIQITRQELGRIVGCSREMASRVLRSFEEKRLVAIDGRAVLVRGVHRPHGSDLARL